MNDLQRTGSDLRHCKHMKNHDAGFRGFHNSEPLSIILSALEKLRALRLFSLVLLCGCDNIPAHWHSAPKTVQADNQEYLACQGDIWIYSPSRNVASSSSKSYEIEFTDDYGHPRDLKNLTSYTISDGPTDPHYAVASVATPDNTATTYSDGSPMKPGVVVLFANGDAGRAIWNGPGKWSPVPCSK
jgi:hypothetical protein